MSWIKEKIRKWLDVDIAEERLDKLELFTKRQNAKIGFLLKQTSKVGIDHHIKGKSWAVVCTKTEKGENVKFYELRDGSITSLRRILRDFSRENVIIDAHPQVLSFLDEFEY